MIMLKTEYCYIVGYKIIIFYIFPLEPNIPLFNALYFFLLLSQIFILQ